MRTIPILIAVVGAGLCLAGSARADEIQFVTLPQVVQTSVIKETHITGPTSVTRVIRQERGVYAVTVHSDAGERVVYVNEAGTILEAPANSTTVEKTVEQAQPVEETPQTVITYDQVQKSESRYQLLEKKGKKEVYLDKQTGEKVTVKREGD